MLNKSIRITVSVFTLTGIISCMGLKKTDASGILIPGFPISGITEIFLQQYALLDKNSSAYSSDINRLAQTYHLKTLPDKNYALCGFIRTDSLFDPQSLLQQGIHLAPPIGNIRTVCIPLSQLDFFFTQPHISYFEANMPVEPL